MIRNLDVFLWNRKAGSFCVPILQGRATGFMHPDAAPAPDARRAKKPPIRRTYLTGRRECLLRYLIPAFVINMTICYLGRRDDFVIRLFATHTSSPDV